MQRNTKASLPQRTRSHRTVWHVGKGGGMSAYTLRNKGLMAIRKCDKQQRSLHSRFNIHSSHKYIYIHSLRSQQSVSQCHNTSPNSSHYPWQHANIPVSEPHLSQASTYRVSHKQLGKFMLSFDLLCSQSVYKSPCLPHSPQIIKHINLQSP